jgi:phosphoadenosine phosphosulfate reductase
MSSTGAAPARHLEQTVDLEQVNAQLHDAPAEQVVQWATRTFGDRLVMTSSFGAQAALMLHLVTRVVPDIPVVFIDTGFHFPETYQFADQLTDRLNLNLKVYAPPLSPAWMVARHGRLWEQQTKEALDRYDQMHKVEPMQRALRELDVQAWLAGLRSGQTEHRAALPRVARQDGLYKIHPVLSWTTKDVHAYLKKHDLPYHPLYEKGYASIGDWHSTFPIGETQHERAGRFRGLKQECGLHLPTSPQESQSRDGSML